MQSTILFKLKTFFVILITAWPSAMFSQSTTSSVKPIELLCEYRENPLGVETQTPRLSWQLTSVIRNQYQTAYRILVASTSNLLKEDKGDMWDTGKIKSEQSNQLLYKGKPLISTKRYFWKVIIWDKAGKSSGWSSSAYWQMGLPTKSDWGKASWIALSEIRPSQRIVPGVQSPAGNKDYRDVESGKHALPQFRKEVTLQRKLKNATAFIAGLGHYELTLNGKKVGDQFLAPGWTNYDKYCFYNVFDVTQQLVNGANVIGVMLGNGFYNVPNERYRKLLLAYGNPKMIFKLLLEYEDGSTEEITSDQSWKVTPSPITFSSIYGGEDYNANLEQPGWMLASFNDSKWSTPILVQGPPLLIAESTPPLKVMESFEPIKMSEPAPGIWVYDLGQNFSGIPQIAVTGSRDLKVKIIPAELLNDKGFAAQAAVGDPVNFNYSLKGEGVEQWQPQFTYYGFRYIQIEGAVPQGKPNPNNLPIIKTIKGLHTRSSAKVVGSFTCSNDLFNKTFKLIDWAIRGNMVSLLTDCPHREKLGWLEEAHLMGNSVRYNYDMSQLLAKSVQDMQATQTDDGLIPDIAPEYSKFDWGFRDSPEWGSAGVILPWYLYQWYGDRKILEDHYQMMERYLTYLQKMAKENILNQGLGDWYDIGPKPPGSSQLTPQGITPTAIYYYDAVIMQKISTLLGKKENALKYAELSKGIKQGFNTKFFNKETAQYGTGSQTANAMAIFMELVEPEYKSKVFANLVQDIHNHKDAMTAGDIGFRYLIQTLQREGASNIIYDMNSKSDVPGYGYQLAHGATALTESWAALTFVSNNHFMLGHLMEWLYSGLGGIRQGENGVGFKEIIIDPQMVGDVTEATTSHTSIYGKIVCHWEKKSDFSIIEIEIPVNTVAVVYLPAKSVDSIQEEAKSLATSEGINFLRNENGKTLIKVGSGKYKFKISTK